MGCVCVIAVSTVVLVLVHSCLHGAIALINTSPFQSSQPSLDSADVSFQVHSYNDLRLWPQLIAKSVTWFKVDPHWMSPQFCESQANVKDADSGCFVLNHDTPSSLRNYNTTEEIVNLMTEKRFLWYFSDPSVRIYIALCFKWDGVDNLCSSLPNATKWRHLLSTFLADANAAIGKYHLNVEFILDGNATPTNRQCLISMYEPLVATWIVGRDPASALIDNNVENGDARFQVNNMPQSSPPASNVLQLQAKKYGKFANSSYPFLFWEPSSQDDIQNVSATYAKGPLAPHGLRFATNIDPVQVSLYASSSSQYGLKDALRFAYNSSNVVVPIEQAEPQSLKIYYTDGGAIVTKNATDLIFYRTSEALLARKGTSLVGATSDVDFFVSLENILLAASQSGAWIFNIAESRTEKYVVAQPVFASFPESLQQNVVLAIAITQDAPTSPINELLVSLAFSSPNSTKVQIIELTLSNPLSTTPRFFTASAPIYTNLSHNENLSVTTTSLSSLYMNRIVYHAIVFTSNSNVGFLSFWHGNINGSPIISIPNFAIGTNPSLKLFESNGSLWLFMGATDAFCWNTETNNKQAYPATCEITPMPVQYAHSYTMSRVLDLQHRAATPELYFGPVVVSPCSTTLGMGNFSSFVHGTFGAGLLPAFHVTTDVNGKNAVHISCIYHTLSSSSFSTSSPPSITSPSPRVSSTTLNSCGMPSTSQQGLAIDTWSLSLVQP
eukprot:m.57588 g.57588  ORF g.57588 m.57588 type:complete len:724 (-) comp7831_c0_seq1:1712-3883(-)